MGKSLVEENNQYYIDCSNAIWATNEIHQLYFDNNMRVLKDADFVIEDEKYIFIVEYKNADFPGASNPIAFNPEEDKRTNEIALKFWDSLHYLTLKGKTKPKKYVYICEYPNGDMVTRARLRNLIKEKLPFALQNSMGTGVRLIEEFEVLSINEWNEHDTYKNYPICPVEHL